MINGLEKRKVFPAFSYFLLQLCQGETVSFSPLVTPKPAVLMHTVDSSVTGDDLRFL